MAPVGFLFVFIIGACLFGSPLRVQATYSVSLSAAPSTVSNPGGETDLTIDIMNGQSSAIPYNCKFVYDDTGKEITSFTFSGPNFDNPQGYKLRVDATTTYRADCQDNFGAKASKPITVAIKEIPVSTVVSIFPHTTAPNSSVDIQLYALYGFRPIQCLVTGPSLSKSHTVTDETNDSWTVAVSPSVTSDYTLTCTDAKGNVDSSMDTLTVSGQPVVSLSAAPSTLPLGGGQAQIGVTAYASTSCTPTDGTSEWKALKSSYFVGAPRYPISTPGWNITKTTTFSLECVNSGGSSVKKSVTVYVGPNAKCGNGVVDEDENEQCDKGKAENSDICPSTCTTTCQVKFDCNSTVDFTSKYSGGASDIEMCTGGDGERDDVHIKPGATVTYTWDAKNEVACSRDASDELDAPFVKCFPQAVPGGGPVAVSPKGSCSIAVPGDADEGAVYQYAMQCTDGASSKKVVDNFWVADVSGSDATCGEDQTQGSADIEILSFSASPQTVPFGFSGDIAFSWKTEVKGNDRGFVPECTLGYGTDSSWNPLTPVIVGLNKSTTLSVSQITGDAGVGAKGTKFMGLNCRIPIDIYHSSDNSEVKETFIYFATDPNAPLR